MSGSLKYTPWKAIQKWHCFFEHGSLFTLFSTGWFQKHTTCSYRRQIKQIIISTGLLSTDSNYQLKNTDSLQAKLEFILARLLALGGFAENDLLISAHLLQRMCFLVHSCLCINIQSGRCSHSRSCDCCSDNCDALRRLADLTFISQAAYS